MIEAIEICKSYNSRTIIDNFNIQIQKGDFISLTGESGKGKTTILNLLGLLEKPDKGNIIIEDTKNPTKKEVMLIQRNLFGYLFQNYALIENETVEKNLNIALEYRTAIDKKEEIKKALSTVNLEGFEKRKIFELSGGEQQRVALARVFLKNCSYIFADEPTGNLDIKNRDMVFNILKKFNNSGNTVVYVTHDTELASKASRQINI
jgi:putative ABC transport system ATP-binding protein